MLIEMWTSETLLRRVSRLRIVYGCSSLRFGGPVKVGLFYLGSYSYDTYIE